MFDWITQLIEGGGYLAIAALMFAENVFPPIPSELIMPFAGFAAARGDLNLVFAVLAGSAGALAGAYLWYWIGARLGVERIAKFAERHGRWLTLTPQDVHKADAWFDRYGGGAVFVGRLVPAVRTLISLPAGVSGMKLPKFLFYSALGTVLWTTLLTLLGYWLEGGYEQVSGYLNPVSNVIVVLMLGWYLYRVATFRRRVPKSN